MSLHRQTDPNSNPAANNLLPVFTPDNKNRRPSNVNVITQDSGQLTQQWDFSSAPVQVACDNFQTHQHFHNEDWSLYNQHTASTEASPLLDEPSNIP